MAINLNNLATERRTVSEGLHKAKITAVTKRLKKKNTANEPDKYYLNICYKTSEGTFFDTITESEENLAQYKLFRLLTATNIPLRGQLTLDDLQDKLAGKELGVYVHIKDQNNGFAPRPEVNINTDMFITLEEYDEAQALAEATTI